MSHPSRGGDPIVALRRGAALGGVSEPDEMNSSKKRVKFVVTGFGPFSGCRSNPTPRIIDELLKELNRRRYDEDGSTSNKTNQLSFDLVKTHVFQTAAETVSAQLHDLYEAFEHSKDDGGVSVMLHLGVHIGSCQFLLEQCAYNDATFRVPDELGYLPTNIKVIEKDDFAFPRRTSLPVDQILSEPLSRICQISIDPGRYVCNYTYFKSLAYCEHLNTTNVQGNRSYDTYLDAPTNKNKVHALFLHVPPLEAISLKEQVNFILDLMQRISLYLSNVSQ
jgi:pyroglutamyl-peptidase